MATIDVIRDILVENLDVDPSIVTEDLTFEQIDADSLDIVELVCELEERLDIDFGEPEGLKNLGDVVKHIESL